MAERTTRQMSDAHEVAVCEALGARRCPGSGNQPNNPMDGRQNRYERPVAFAFDGKSTFSATNSITLAMWEKAAEQAHGERPMLALRWYATRRLAVALDLAVVLLEDLGELLDRSDRLAEFEVLLDQQIAEYGGDDGDDAGRAALRYLKGAIHG